MIATAATVLCLAAVLLAAVAWGRHNWARGTTLLHARMEAARAPVRPARYDARVIDALPAPVQRFFRAALRDGQAMVASARFTHEGQMRLADKAAGWVPFTSSQLVVTNRPGFDWDARVRVAPGVCAFVHDSYAGGEGGLHAQVLGLVTVARLQGGGQLAQAELLRYLAEAAWYPTALLPGQGVTWEPLDANSARATLTDGDHRAVLDFRFDATGMIDSVFAPARYQKNEGGVARFLPWQGQFSGHALQGGMRIPMWGEVSWVQSDGPRAYWRGRITLAEFEWADRPVLPAEQTAGQPARQEQQASKETP